LFLKKVATLLTRRNTKENGKVTKDIERLARTQLAYITDINFV